MLFLVGKSAEEQRGYLEYSYQTNANRLDIVGPSRFDPGQ
jgi:hypothetical protein